MAFDFRQKLVEDGEIDEEAASSYARELRERFAESPEGAALAERGIEPGEYLGLFLDYGLRYTGVSLADMDQSEIRRTLDVLAEKVTAEPADLDRAIPELEAFCDFVRRAFGFEEAAAWKRAIRDYAPTFRRAVRDPRGWGMAKSVLMEGLARGFDLSTEEGINRWMFTKQAEQIARGEAERGLAPGGGMSFTERLRRVFGATPAEEVPGLEERSARWPDPAALKRQVDQVVSPGSDTSGASRLEKARQKRRRKQAEASRRQQRRR